MKRVFSAVLALAMMATVLTSCNSQNDNQSGSGSNGEKVNLSFMNHTDEQNTIDWEDKMVSDYQKKYPNVTIDVQRMSFDNYNTSLQTKIASGDAPDLFYTEGDQMKKFNTNGYLLDLTSQDFVNNYTKDNLSQFTLDNKVIAIGFSTGSMCVVYNKDAFTKAGITAVPTTEKELYEDCDKLKAAGISAFAQGYKEAWCIDADMQADYITAILSKDKDSITNLTSRKTKFQDSQDWKDEFTRLAKRSEYGNSDPFGTDSNGAYSLVASGKAAMILNGNWAIAGIRGINEDANLGVFALPFSDTASENKLLIQPPTQGIAIYSGSSHQKEALNFLDLISTPDAGTEFGKMTKNISAVNGAEPTSDAAVKDIYSYIDKDNIFNQGSIDHNFPNEYRTALEKDISDFLLKHTSVDDLCKTLDQDFDKIEASK